jgi:putative tryptophan/tyrosine transport system substrate-binding protein
MRRRDGLALLGCAVLSPLFARAQQRTHRLCFLTFDPIVSRTTRYASFFDELQRLGLTEGQTLTVDWMSADGDSERFPAVARECVQRTPDIIVTTTTPAAQAAKAATARIPIVMLYLGDPIATGLVESLAQPGGNVTGTTFMAAGTAGKRLEILREIVPGISRVLLLAYTEDPISRSQIDSLEDAARRTNMTIVLHEVRKAEDITAAYEHARRAGAEALMTTAESIFAVEHNRVLELSARLRLPTMYPSGPRVRAGGLIAYGADLQELTQRTAEYVRRILGGAEPRELPVQQPTKFELVVNLRAARSLNLTIPESVLARADEVID